MKGKGNQIRHASAVYELEVMDEEGRLVTYRVQIDARGISCWTADHEGGRLTPNQLFAACVQAPETASHAN